MKYNTNIDKGNNYLVYKHVNKINGKIYIGITGREPNARWRNGNGYKGQSYFYNAICKYGWGNFDHIIIRKGLTLEEAELVEKILIKRYKTTNRNFGYNIRPKSNTKIPHIIYQYDNQNGILIKVWESANQAAQTLRIKECSILNSCRTKKASKSKYFFSFEYLGKVLDAKTLYEINYNKSKKIIVQYDLYGKFMNYYNSITDAEKTLKRGKISLFCMISMGYIWREATYELLSQENKNLTKEDFDSMLKNHKASTQFPCYQYDSNGAFIKAYDSIESTNNEGFNPQLILKVCLKTIISHRGYYWRFTFGKNVGDNLTYDDMMENIDCSRRKEVLQYDLNGNLIRKYKSVTEAAKSISDQSTNISKACKRKKSIIKNSIWRYSNEPLNANEHIEVINFLNRKKKPVLQYDRNNNLMNQFESAADAARQTNCDPRGIIRCCNGEYSHHHNYIWKYA